MRSLKLPSGETRRVLVACMATVGQVGNTDHENVAIGKAGRNRWKGDSPDQSRGIDANPVDHPHGGGEGKTSGGRHPVTPWETASTREIIRHTATTSGLMPLLSAVAK